MVMKPQLITLRWLLQTTSGWQITCLTDFYLSKDASHSIAVFKLSGKIWPTVSVCVCVWEERGSQRNPQVRTAVWGTRSFDLHTNWSPRGVGNPADTSTGLPKSWKLGKNDCDTHPVFNHETTSELQSFFQYPEAW